jgi:flagellar motor switch protein FliM
VDQLPYAVAMADEVPRQSLVAVLHVDPLETQVALAMDMRLAICLASRLLGGNPEPPPEDAETQLTAVEAVVAQRALESLVDVLSATWHELAEISFSTVGTSTSAIGVQLAPPSEPSLLLKIPVTFESLESGLTLVLPHQAIEAITPKLDQTTFGPAVADPSARLEMHSAVRTVNVELRAEVASVEMPLAEVLELGAGDVVRLRRPASQGVVLHVDEVPAYVAAPGRNGNVRAVQVKEPWKAP